tara:strand:+ start:7037 stop:7306 length:270 start_codon:yes stop_codon:yes gene_type:complete
VTPNALRGREHGDHGRLRARDDAFDVPREKNHILIGNFHGTRRNSVKATTPTTTFPVSAEARAQGVSSRSNNGKEAVPARKAETPVQGL